MWPSKTQHDARMGCGGPSRGRDSKFFAPVATRALAIVHTCVYDAWAAYDEKTVGTQLGGALRRPASERIISNFEEYVHFGIEYSPDDKDKQAIELDLENP